MTTTYTVSEKKVGTKKISVLSYNDWMQLSEENFGLIGFVQLNCWAVEAKGDVPCTAYISGGVVTAEAPINGPPPPLIKPRGNSANLNPSTPLFVNAKLTSTSKSSASFPSFPANVFIIPWNDKPAPAAISELESILLKGVSPTGTLRYHVYNIEDPNGEHPFHQATIAIPVPATNAAPTLVTTT